MARYSGIFCLLAVVAMLLSSASAQYLLDCPAAPTNPGDRRTDKNLLSIAQYNAYFLFDLDGPKNPTMVPWTTQEEVNRHLDTVASELRRINADMVNLCEVKSCQVLHELIARLPDLGYAAYMIDGTDSATGQNVGLLTRVDPMMALTRTENRVAYPVQDSTCGYKYTGTTGLSKHYYTHFSINSETKANALSLFMVGLHFKAFPTDPGSCAQREAQAHVVSDLLMTNNVPSSGASVIVLGDLNDYDREVLDVNNNVPLSSALHFLKDVNTAVSGDELFNVAELITKDDRYTCWWDKNNDGKDTPDENSSIDHILMSNDLKPAVIEAHAVHNYDSDLWYSDHWPVLVRLDLNKLGSAQATVAVEQTQQPEQPSFVSQYQTPLIAGGVSAGIAAIGALVWSMRNQAARGAYAPIV